jgi:hypothetical protein
MCAKQGATLVHIENAAENAWIASNLESGGGDLWIGLTADKGDKHHQWEGDGILKPLTYSNWFPGEPNGSGKCVPFTPRDYPPFSEYTSASLMYVCMCLSTYA